MPAGEEEGAGHFPTPATLSPVSDVKSGGREWVLFMMKSGVEMSVTYSVN